MSMLDSFLARGFKASKCKTLLKLTIPRIKLLRNRKELSIKQMRRDIAKLLETGQEATARIRVEHIIREENMMAAQEIIELFCELIAVRLPIIEAQRECPLDLKEAISSVCFAAPRCADLPELMQVQMAFAGKYGKEFIAAATELMPNCGVNRQLIELLSVRAPPPEKKLKLLKEIAEEHELDWDPAPSESELFKSHDDLLNGPTQFVTGTKVPLPNEKHEDIPHPAPPPPMAAESDSEDGFDELDFPEVPKSSIIRPPGPAPDTADLAAPSSHASAPPPEELHHHHTTPGTGTYADPTTNPESPKSVSVAASESKQFLPFLSPPSPSLSIPPASLSTRENTQNSQSQSPYSMAKMEDLHDILAAAKAAAESAERAAAAARSAASLAEVKISELTKTKSSISQSSSSGGGNGDVENPFYTRSLSERAEKLHLDDGNDMGNNNVFGNPQAPADVIPDFQSHQPQRIPSMEDDPAYTYPNLFSPPPKPHSPDN